MALKIADIVLKSMRLKLGQIAQASSYFIPFSPRVLL
ncbi:hypothetical protein VSF3289_04566 [Vibrio scophthalmi]|uniref:Uncharacterized protein n=1 Tax=Vibrio scophthalmi TaxID=45658 RepID=A0A1E3WHY5_9VIBR|nr:hypothetical protein VSF3289_04566 [Vibrio scophthalmi]